MLNAKLITDPDVVSIISLEDCWKHLRITPDDDSPPSHPDDDDILDKLGTARTIVEEYTGRALTPRTLEIALDNFPCTNEGIKLPWAPVASITSVAYIDENGDPQTFATNKYVLDLYQEPCWLLPAFEENWPSTRSVVNAIIVRYVAGYSLRTATQTRPLPKPLKGAVKLLLGTLYENRESAQPFKLEDMPLSVQAMCMPYKIDWALA